MKTPTEVKYEAAQIREHLRVIGILADVLTNNGGYKGEPDDIDNPPQINDRGEYGIQQAIQLLAGTAHRDFCQMTTDLGVPE